ncbi:AI-2E family transporter [Haloimpatiens lingqiaonensis]|uniref:AI-2E family transporter n=1 Tax=Haloimpatiens lingqiaonensis TaxID=1380675 RepID=UPI0010FDDA5F|nr:AI-2E family transporter [Haloimpatiens lingqiaonensis]
MKFDKNKIKYFDLIVAVFIIFIGIELILNYKTSVYLLGKVVKILKPFIVAFIVAYALNPVIKFLERKFNLKRNYSILITYIFFIGIIALFSTIVIPKIFYSGMDMLHDIPNFALEVSQWIDKNLAGRIGDLGGFFNNNAGELLKKFSTMSSTWLNIGLSKLVNLTNSLINLIFGLIIAIYILASKEKYKELSKDFIYVTFREKWGNKIINFINNVNRMVSLYIGIKALDSLIIGAIALVGFIIFKSPYALILGLVVAVTNMIPYFGPFVGMLPAFIINVFYSPKKAVFILLFLILLQQFDAWYLEPKLVGDKVGLSPFLIILGITILGSLFGIWGMLLASPIMAVLKIYIGGWFKRKVEEYKNS